MARCTAPVEGHRSASAQAACPACCYKSGRYGGGYGGRYSRPYSEPTYTRSYTPFYSSGGGGGGGGSRSSRGSRLAGLLPDRLSCTLPRKSALSPRFARPSRNERPCPTFGTSSCATHGTTASRAPMSCTNYSSRAGSRSGSARLTSSLVSRSSARSTKAWQGCALGSCW